MEIINTNAVYIPSLDGKDIYISNSLDPKNGYRLKNKTGNLNLSRFINSLDYSLDLIKLKEIFDDVCPDDVFSYFENRKEYTYQIINVTFNYSAKLFNRIIRGDDIYYIKFGYSIDDLDFDDCIALKDNELVGIQIQHHVNIPITDQLVLTNYFKYDDVSKSYLRNTHKKQSTNDVEQQLLEKYNCDEIDNTIPTLNSVANIRSEIYENGFICEGIKYVRFKRSSGSSRVGKCLFINEKLYDIMHEWEMCGIQVYEGQDTDLAALETYIALTLSSIINTIEIKPENILVVDDYKSVFHERAIATRLVDGWLVSKPEDVEISNSIWDGQSLMDRSLFGEYSNKGMLLLRARFFKSCCFNANIQQWFADHGIKKISQLNGYTRAKKIEDVKLITTPSSIKYLKFGTLDHWLDTLETTFGVVKYEKKTHFFDGRGAKHDACIAIR